VKITITPFVVLAMLMSCASSNNRYYFDYYTTDTRIATTEFSHMDSLKSNATLVTQNTTVSFSKEPLGLSGEMSVTHQDYNASLSKKYASQNNRIKEIKKYDRYRNSTEPDSHDKRKNIFALTGFSSSVTGLIFLVYIFGAVIQTLPLVIVGLSISAIGAILSYLGRKSKRRIWAILGLWIGVGVVGFGVVLGALALLLKGLGADL